MSQAPDRFISIAEFSRRSSLSRGTLYNLVERGDLPAPAKLTPNRVAWPSNVVDDWLASRLDGAVSA